MKKYIVFFAFFAALFAVSCSPYTDEEAGGTAVQDLSGTWTVIAYYSALEADGAGDLSNASKAELDAAEWVPYYNTYQRTYNTAANLSTEMWFEDNFWGDMYKVDTDCSKLSFSCEDVETEAGINVTARYGQVLKGAATTYSGRQADSIVVYINYSDDPGFTYKIAGFRYTGYTEDLN